MAFGIINNENTCYINSVLQCLLNTRLFRKYFKGTITDDPVIIAIQGLVRYYESGKNARVNPNTFLSAIFEKLHFERGHQEDAHEFLFCLLDYIHMKIKYDVIVNVRDTIESTDNVKQCKDSWSKYCHNNYSFITKLFYGQCRNEIICGCGKVSITREPICGLSVSPSENSTGSIQTGIDDHLSGDVVETICNQCKENSFKIINKIIEIVPEYLMVQVLRFNNNLTKDETSLDFLSDINLSDHVDKTINKNDIKYSLQGVIFHAGRLSFGHYLSAIRKIDGSWSVINDESIINDTPNGPFFKSNVYMLMYKKIKVNNLHDSS